jgi:hypothetical protein
MQPAEIIRPEHCAHLIVAQEQIGEPAPIPLYRAVQDGLVTAVLHRRGARVEASTLWPKRRPTVIVLGDDDYQSTGPCGWPQAVRLMRWAALIILHGSGGTPEHYGMAVVAAVVRRRVLFVETSAAQLAAWKLFIDKLASPNTSALVIAPFGDRSHPRASAPVGAIIQ